MCIGVSLVKVFTYDRRLPIFFFFTFKDLFTQIYMKKYMIGTISVTAAHMWTGPALIEG